MPLPKPTYTELNPRLVETTRYLKSCVEPYQDTIYNNPFEQPWDRDPDYLVASATFAARWRPLRQAIEDFEFFADGAPLPLDLVGQRALAEAERRDLVFKYFLRYYEAALASGSPSDCYQLPAAVSG